MNIFVRKKNDLPKRIGISIMDLVECHMTEP